MGTQQMLGGKSYRVDQNGREGYIYVDELFYRTSGNAYVSAGTIEHWVLPATWNSEGDTDFEVTILSDTSNPREFSDASDLWERCQDLVVEPRYIEAVCLNRTKPSLRK